MNHDTCKRCGRSIVYVKRSDNHEGISLEKIYPYKIDITMIGSTAVAVVPDDGESLYVAHVAVCPRGSKQT